MVIKSVDKIPKRKKKCIYPFKVETSSNTVLRKATVASCFLIVTELLEPMGKNKIPSTNALRALRSAKVEFEIHRYPYEEGGGTARSAQELGVDEYNVVKTLVMECDANKPLIILMHGDHEVSTKTLARHLGVKSIQPCKPEIALKHSGYLVGGTSPFGTKKKMPIYVEHSILELATIYINCGQRGLLVSLAPSVLLSLLKASPVRVARS